MPVKGKSGVMNVDDVRAAIRPKWYHFPRTALICAENTHNRAGGTIYPIDDLRKLTELARSEGIRTHLDGARIFNASVESGISIKDYASLFDSISFCFSKGLGAPVGSVLCSDSNTIEIAHRIRKVLGGGMRQAGIIAAGALFALENNIDRLKDDHKKAKLFAEEISGFKNIQIDLRSVQTNIVVFKTLVDASLVKAKLEGIGVLVTSEGADRIRAVFHMDVSEGQLMEAIGILKNIMD